MATTVPKTNPGFKPKKSVALSGIVAGNTALCTVGRSGNDLHYRGYDILDIAEACEFEEIAHLLVHDKLPTKPELAAYKQKLRSLRGLPAQAFVVDVEGAGALVFALAVRQRRTAMPADPRRDRNRPAGDAAARLFAATAAQPIAVMNAFVW